MVVACCWLCFIRCVLFVVCCSLFVVRCVLCVACILFVVYVLCVGFLDADCCLVFVFD